MRRVFQSLIATIATQNDAVVIAVGLASLILAMLWPGMPAVSAMALVALGATSVTLARFRGTPALVPVMLLHLTIYGSLYALFVGATLHAAATRSVDGLNLFAAADLAASALPMAIVTARTWGSLGLGTEPKR